MSESPSKKDKKSKKEKAAAAAAEGMSEDVEMTDTVAAKTDKKKKDKKDKDELVVPIEDLSPIAQPLAQKKLLKKLHKTVKKASKQRHLKRGVKEVVKGIRKGEKGLVVLAADITPIDIISHLPVMCEDAQIPYVFVSSKEELGHAGSTKRPTSCVFITPDQKKKPKTKEGETIAEDSEYRELYDECYKEVSKMDTVIAF